MGGENFLLGYFFGANIFFLTGLTGSTGFGVLLGIFLLSIWELGFCAR